MKKKAEKTCQPVSEWCVVVAGWVAQAAVQSCQPPWIHIAAPEQSGELLIKDRIPNTVVTVKGESVEQTWQSNQQTGDDDNENSVVDSASFICVQHFIVAEVLDSRLQPSVFKSPISTLRWRVQESRESWSLGVRTRDSRLRTPDSRLQDFKTLEFKLHSTVIFSRKVSDPVWLNQATCS